MNLHLTLSAPLPWLTAASRLLRRRKSVTRHRVSSILLPRTLSFTKEGIWFVVILLVIGVAAINTGNNLLYLIVAMMLSFIIMSGILSESTLRGITISRTLPKHLFVERPATVRYSVSNEKKLFSSYSFSIEELPHDGMSSEAGYVLKIPARAEVSQVRSCMFRKRGVHHLEGFKVKTRFPFGLFLKGRRLGVPAEVLVYPKIKPLKDIPLAHDAGHGAKPERIRGLGSHLHSIRDYTLMDDSRIIHWKSTAKTSRLMAKEFEQEGTKRIKIIVQNSSMNSPDFVQVFEDRVEEAASLADYFIRAGFEVGLKSLSKELPCRPGKEQLYKILRELALIEPVITEKNIPPEVRVISV